jgi:hypothetical protein
MVSSISIALISAIAALINATNAATPAQWRSQSIYQVFTDRFALTKGSSITCAAGFEGICGGSWQGIINNLDYIQVRALLNSQSGTCTNLNYSGYGFHSNMDLASGSERC